MRGDRGGEMSKSQWTRRKDHKTVRQEADVRQTGNIWKPLRLLRRALRPASPGPPRHNREKRSIHHHCEKSLTSRAQGPRERHRALATACRSHRGVVLMHSLIDAERKSGSLPVLWVNTGLPQQSRTKNVIPLYPMVSYINAAEEGCMVRRECAGALNTWRMRSHPAVSNDGPSWHRHIPGASAQ
ncbi:hypothetical protein SKAU_G00027850 [Synaphobranchus kaupii]|uniref:Uncharacterized protein n=1 Tax=Synaphobranchus kaupii TaxID=118154 RepID=A0A9Q1GEZ7_SYNKA|nr:hypothetical protein SKAU_G00027850 [Synaphobranchus kaupii]